MHTFISCHFRNWTVYDQTVFHSDVYSIRHDCIFSIITNYLFKHWLDTTRNIVNPVKVIGQVLNYARKNKHPKNCSALIYWEEDYPSRLDLGKDKYGGLFSLEQVEDVKTFLRLIPLLISVVGVFCVRELTVNCFFLFKTKHHSSFLALS